MLKSLRRWLIRKLRDDDYDSCAIVGSDSTSSRLRSTGLNFTVYKASGGLVLETHDYDNKNHTESHAIHIIADEHDIGEHISKIITVELLRR